MGCSQAPLGRPPLPDAAAVWCVCVCNDKRKVFVRESVSLSVLAGLCPAGPGLGKHKLER